MDWKNLGLEMSRRHTVGVESPLNAKPRTPNPKLRTPNLKPEAQTPKPLNPRQGGLIVEGMKLGHADDDGEPIAKPNHDLARPASIRSASRFAHEPTPIQAGALIKGNCLIPSCQEQATSWLRAYKGLAFEV